jgi:antirestriction protein
LQKDDKQNKKDMIQEEYKSEFEIDKKYRKYQQRENNLVLPAVCRRRRVCL